MIDFGSLFQRLVRPPKVAPVPPIGTHLGLDDYLPDLRRRLREDLIRHEGLRLHPYQDTVGKWTIGVGRNLSDRGISEAEAMAMLDHDIEDAIAEVHARLPWVLDLDDERRLVIYNMAFNLGAPKLLGFTKTLAAIQRGEWFAAATGMLASKWATQVGRRATELADRMRHGHA